MGHECVALHAYGSIHMLVGSGSCQKALRLCFMTAAVHFSRYSTELGLPSLVQAEKVLILGTLTARLPSALPVSCGEAQLFADLHNSVHNKQAFCLVVCCSSSNQKLVSTQLNSASICTPSAASSLGVKCQKPAAYVVKPSARYSPPQMTSRSCCYWAVCIASIIVAGRSGARNSPHAPVASSLCL